MASRVGEGTWRSSVFCSTLGFLLPLIVVASLNYAAVPPILFFSLCTLSLMLFAWPHSPDFLDRPIELDWEWAYSVALGATVIVLVTFKGDIMSRGGLPLPIGRTAWERWHAAALSWTLIVLIYYALKLLPLVGPATYKVLVVGFAILTGVVIYAESGVGRQGTATDGPGHSPVIPAAFIALFFCCIDVIACKGISLQDSKTDGHVARTRERNRVRQTLFLADLPSLISFAVIYLWSNNQPASDLLEAFLYGAISFQLISAKVLLMLIDGGVLDRHH